MRKHSLFITLSLSASLFFAQKKSGIRLDIIDKTIDPKEDFFKYACGNWLKNNTIPETESAWGSFNEIKDRNDKNLKEIITEISNDKNAVVGSNRQKMRDFYNLAMDTLKLEKDGLKYMSAYFSQIEKIKTPDDLIKTIADFHASGISCAFGFGIESDLKNSEMNAVYLGQSGTFLPDRDFYFDIKYEAIRTAYQQHVKNMFQLFKINEKDASSEAKVVFDLEKKIG